MDDHDTGVTFKTEYASSGRSKCNRCRQPIDQSELRIGPLVQSDKGDFKYPQWHHFSCFEDGYLKKHPAALKNTNSIGGIDALRFEDQKKVKSLVLGGDSALETKALTEEEKQIAADSKLIWARKEKLEALDNRELQALLEHNKQPCSGKIFGGRGKMLERAADAMAFGALPKCTVCKTGDFVFSHGQYKCVGAVDEFAKCVNVVKDIDREALRIPKFLADQHDFLAKYKFKPRERVAAVVEASATQPESQEPSQVGQKRGAREALAPFAGCSVVFVGKLSRTQKELQALITSNGGVVASSPGAASICVCTTEEATGNGTQKGKDAVKKGVLCVSEAWVDASIKAGSRLSDDDLAPFTLANPRFTSADDDEREKRRQLGDKLAVEYAAAQQRAMLEEKFSDKPAGGNKSQQQPIKRVIVKGNTAVEPSSGLAEVGTIYEAGGKKYTAVMSDTNVATGKNSFYILQLIQHDTGKRWSIYRKWGKVGDDSIGGDKLQSFPSVEPAIREFKKVFLDKTSNEWGAPFKKQYGKFQLVEVDYSGGGGGADGAANAATSGYTGPLDRATQELITMIFDVKAMNDTLTQLDIDTTKLPLGNLSKATIAEGFAALSTLEKLLKARAASGDAAQSAVESSQITSLSNKFYTFIPHVAPAGGGRLPLLDTLDLVKEKAQLLTSLQDLELASKMLIRADSASAARHPIDEHYARLRTDLKTVPKDSAEFARVNAYLQNTHASTHAMYELELVDLWEVSRHGEDALWAPWKDSANRQLLWHGSRLTNWGGILSQGLRIAPPEAPSTGYMFGKALYFANSSSKSANYCFTTSEKTRGLMLLSEVALGTQQEFRKAHYVEGLDPKFASVKGVGRNHPDPAGSYTEPNGCVWPTGKIVPSGVTDTSLMYDEHMIYRVDQYHMRYLLRLEFHYKKKMGTFH